MAFIQLSVIPFMAGRGISDELTKDDICMIGTQTKNYATTKFQLQKDFTIIAVAMLQVEALPQTKLLVALPFVLILSSFTH